MSDKKTTNGNGEPKLDDRLKQLLIEHFGDNWARLLQVNVRADRLFWLYKLAIEGLRARYKEAKASGNFVEQIGVTCLRLDVGEVLEDIKTACEKHSVSAKRKKTTKK